MHADKRGYSLFSIDAEIPKLDVAGSSPVSRSIFSITWKLPKFTRYSVYSVFFPATGWKTACPAVLPSPESRVALLNHLGFEALHRFDLLLKIAH